MVKKSAPAYKVREIRADRIFNFINNTFLLVCFVIVLYPLVYIVASSFSSPQAVIAHKVWLFPVNFDTVSYKAVFANKDIASGYMNSIIYVALGTFTSCLLYTSDAADEL